jgi:hypothetical protein
VWSSVSSERGTSLIVFGVSNLIVFSVSRKEADDAGWPCSLRCTLIHKTPVLWGFILWPSIFYFYSFRYLRLRYSFKTLFSLYVLPDLWLNRIRILPSQCYLYVLYRSLNGQRAFRKIITLKIDWKAVGYFSRLHIPSTCTAWYFT